MTELEKDLARLLNSYSCESASNTPDYILAKYLTACLKAYDDAVSLRESWHHEKVIQKVGRR